MTSPERRPLRWGVVGTGPISRQMVADFALVPDAAVSAVASREVARADEFADEFGIAERYASRREMFASDIDAVYIATPHVTHFEVASEAIAAGRHVLCEKPLGMNEREVRELSAQAVDAGVFLMEAMWMKFNPLYARLAQLIAEGVLGDVRGVRAAFGAAFPQDGSSRWMPGGSTLLDQGIYPVTLAHMLLGRPDTVHARGTVRPDGVDLREDFSLGYADDRFAHGASSMVEWIDPSAAISGTDAYVTITGGFWWASQLTIHNPLPWEQRRQEVIEVEREGNGYVPMLRAVVDAIRAGELEHPLHTAAATAEIYSTLDEIRRQITG
jgi:predicted dehydrogenase